MPRGSRQPNGSYWTDKDRRNAENYARMVRENEEAEKAVVAAVSKARSEKFEEFMARSLDEQYGLNSFKRRLLGVER
jgi:hypothetical protein